MSRSDISADRLSLAPLRPAHAAALYPLLHDWEVVRMLADVPWPLALADVEAFAAEPPEQSGRDDFAILLGGAPIGVCSLKRPGSGQPPRKMPRLGYWLGRPYWGRGHATEAVAALVRHAFASFPQDVVGAGVFRDNAVSRRVLEKLGFREEGGYDVHCLARGGPVATANMLLAHNRFAG
jgi:RimJ/RimL family protein N-acetyltransferase